MAHPMHCGEECSTCTKYCKLDESIPCSPDCEGLNSVTGEPDSDACKTCDAINNNEKSAKNNEICRSMILKMFSR